MLTCDPTVKNRKEIGFSKQKIVYSRELSKAILKDRLNLKKLCSMDDTSVQNTMMKIKGIGSWTADIYPDSVVASGYLATKGSSFGKGNSKDQKVIFKTNSRNAK
ncbi:MAG: hypothetical protein GY832_14260 [Chloroflexi bacterium]|nr:hypothetical protein [Chloroflexota bacterium]